MNETTYFDLLGLDIDDPIDQASLKAAYRQAARTHHPDAGGDPETFRQVQAAFEVLKDPAQTRLYRAEVALRQARTDMASGRRTVMREDYMPYVLAQIDPDAVYTSTAYVAPDVARAEDAQEARVEEEFEHARQAAGDDGVYERAQAFADEVRRAQTGGPAAAGPGRSRTPNPVVRALEELNRYPAWLKAAAIVGGYLIAQLALWLWDSGITPMLWGIGEGDRFSLLRTYDAAVPHDNEATFWWGVIGAGLSYVTVGFLWRTHRRWRSDVRVLVGVAVTTALLGISLPALGGYPWSLPAVGAGAWGAHAAWVRARKDRFLDTDAARRVGLYRDEGGDLRVRPGAGSG